MLHKFAQVAGFAAALLSALPSTIALRASLDIVNRVIAPDGYRRSTVLANGVYPSPLLSGFVGDDFRINVINRLRDPSMLRGTSIHWHGFFQTGTNWADGPAFVNQCPISANHSFLYNFNVGRQSGTYWYHSHYSTQYCDGLRGPMVVYDRRDPYRRLYDVDDESTVITLSDWYHTVSPAAGRLPTPDSTLINGLGRYNNNGTVARSRLSVVNVRRGLRYRMRLVSLSCDANYVFSIDGHNMTIIEADGVLTEPHMVDSIQIFAAQRYSFILHANQHIGNYWIRARPNKGNSSFAGGLNSAILRYRGAHRREPTSNETTSVIPLREFNLRTRNHPGVSGGAAPGAVDKAIHLQVGFNPAALGFTLNGVAFHPPSVPVLLQILSGTQNPADLLPAGSLIDLPGNATIEISITGAGNHPFHLHGHNFDVVRSAGSTNYNYVNPVRRDVVNVGTGGDNVTVRFVTDNPGPWFLHCHIEWHLEAGLAVVLAENIPRVAAANPVPAAWKELCPIFNSLSPDQL